MKHKSKNKQIKTQKQEKEPEHTSYRRRRYWRKAKEHQSRNRLHRLRCPNRLCKFCWDTSVCLFKTASRSWHACWWTCSIKYENTHIVVFIIDSLVATENTFTNQCYTTRSHYRNATLYIVNHKYLTSSTSPRYMWPVKENWEISHLLIHQQVSHTT